MDIPGPVLSYRVRHCWSSQSSDSEFYSLSSPETLSPAYSMDFSLSPSPQPLMHGKESWMTFPETICASVSPSSGEEGAPQSRKVRGRRSQNPSKQRQRASEKEKLRMRDLTKALHRLRTHLPPSLAPAGQTLTKIETLRLTIRYIAHLSAQLQLAEEALCRRKETHAYLDQTHHPAALCGHGSVPGIWGHRQGEIQPAGGCQSTPASTYPVQDPGVDHSHFSTALGGSFEVLPEVTHHTFMGRIKRDKQHRPQCPAQPHSTQNPAPDDSLQP
ncbi:mesogenin-1-like [Megalops cyprinoides]|uniref:mesogenin-1-like n=1 Tax=Megalops cyprinoides TaxID=118141 RepID=UPI001863B8C5|nr:mesogenin-1-like [Megalops cyprinoides]